MPNLSNHPQAHLVPSRQRATSLPGAALLRLRSLAETAWLLLLSAFAMLLLGYHPFAEDGGIYTAAIEARLHPALFPHDRVWVTAHTRFALFAPLTAILSKALHLPLATVLFVLYAAGLFALLAAAAHLARTCFPKQVRPWLATFAVAVASGLPVAGTSLYAVDPYCTARTITTPLLVFALSFALRSRWQTSAVCWLAASTMHPLMALWAALPLLLIAASSTQHPWRWKLALTATALLAALLLSVTASPETAATYAAAHTRAYWFPAQWRWYEWIGAAAPCLLLRLFAKLCRTGQPALPRLASAALLTTAIATALALCFAQQAAASLTIARLQPMRSLHLVFLAFLCTGGAFLQNRFRTFAQRCTVLAALLIMAASLFSMQRSLFPNTAHLEWPGTRLTNPWEAAFAWCSDNTPADALFALDADYIDLPGEDSHGFRAIALRSALPDSVKDAGIAAVLPPLTQAWLAGSTSTQHLNGMTDVQRRERLLPLDVTWIVLPASAATTMNCPYRNAAAQVCKLP